MEYIRESRRPPGWLKGGSGGGDPPRKQITIFVYPLPLVSRGMKSILKVCFKDCCNPLWTPCTSWQCEWCSYMSDEDVNLCLNCFLAPIKAIFCLAGGLFPWTPPLSRPGGLRDSRIYSIIYKKNSLCITKTILQIQQNWFMHHENNPSDTTRIVYVYA